MIFKMLKIKIDVFFFLCSCVARAARWYMCIYTYQKKSISDAMGRLLEWHVVRHVEGGVQMNLHFQRGLRKVFETIQYKNVLHC